jgi:N-acetylneuraminic acid mutarotase
MKSKFVLTFIIIPICFIYSQQGNWNSLGQMISPVACGEILFNGMQGNPKFYLLGGYSIDYLQTKVDWIQEYDILSGTWNMFPYNMNSPRSSFIAALWDSTIVYLGGSQDNYLESIDFIDGHASVVYDTNNNFNRLKVSGHVVGDDLFIIGGTNIAGADNFPFIADYNLKQKKINYSFSFLNYFKDAQDIMTVAVDSSIYIIGGVINTPVNMINKFSVTNKNLSLLSQHLSLPRAGGSAVYNPNSKKIYVIGGYDQINSALSTVEVIELNQDGTLNISNGPPLKTARKYPMAISYGNKIYVFGGYDQSNQVVSDIEVYTDSVITEVSREHLPYEFALIQNYPNPFNPTTTISYDLPKATNVILKVYNILGEEIATLVNKVMPAGHQSVAFNAAKLASGMYIYRIEAGSFVQVKKMLLMK